MAKKGDAAGLMKVLVALVGAVVFLVVMTFKGIAALVRCVRDRNLPAVADGSAFAAIDRDGSSTAEVLGDAFDRYQAGAIDLDEYRSLVQAEAAVARERKAEVRQDRKLGVYADEDDFQEALDQADDDIEECRWRLEWIEKKAWSARASRADIADSGKWARFDYVDAKGNASKRVISMWEKRGAYVAGFDRSRGEERSFRQDRIENWTAG